MKYAAILTYTTGSVTGITIEADCLQRAWQELTEHIPTERLQSVSIAEIPSPEHEIKQKP